MLLTESLLQDRNRNNSEEWRGKLLAGLGKPALTGIRTALTSDSLANQTVGVNALLERPELIDNVRPMLETLLEKTESSDLLGLIAKALETKTK